MKVITQFEQKDIEDNLFSFNSNRIYITNRELYSFFLSLDELNYEDYLLNKFPHILKEINSIPNWDIYEKSRVRNINRHKFDKERPKFYLIEDEIYSYKYLGEMNVGHVIEIWHYDKNDLLQILNFQMKPSFLNRIIDFFHFSR